MGGLYSSRPPPRGSPQVSLRPEVVVYTDAATSAALIAASVIDVVNFANGPAFDAVLIERVDMSRFGIFAETNLIYGLEMLAVIATTYALRDFAAGRNLIFYVDNSNTKDALVKGHSDSPVIDKLIKIFWAFAQSSWGLGFDRTRTGHP